MSKTLDKILERLELTEDKGLYYDCIKSKQCSSRLKIALQYIEYDAIYTINNSPFIIFREFSTLDEFKFKIKDLIRAVWNLGEVPILFIILPNEIRIYDGLNYNEKLENNALNAFKIKDNEALSEFKALNLTSSEFWKKYGNNFKKDKKVQDYLLKNLKYVRTQLRNQGLSLSIIHNLIGRLIFSRYLIDRNALPQQFFIENYDSTFENLIKDKENLYDYFEYLKIHFKGDMFPFIDNEKNDIHENHLNLISNFFKGTEVETGQTILFDKYDFKIIPIELISNIYEMFLDEGKKNRSKKSYYTPLFLVDYILDERLDALLNDKESCRIFDPSCGSGVFLVEALRRLIEKKLEYKPNLSDSELKNILTENIFGVDKDSDAISISIFSLYLTLLDYQEPKNIEKFEFPELENKNLFEADFFDLENQFNQLINNVDLIVGNPPWGSINGLHVDYCKMRNIPISNNQIAQSFLIRTQDFIHKSSEIALIVTSKILYNTHPKSRQFRKYFLEKFDVSEVLESSSLRKKIFKKAVGPAATLFFKLKNEGKENTNNIKHISLKPSRLFYLLNSVVIQKFNVKYIPQKYFIEYDWIWKVVLYGSILDFYFIKRLKESYPTINELIEERNLIKGVGIQFNGPDKPKDASHLADYPYLDTKNDMINRYEVNIENASKLNTKKLNRTSNENLFKPPQALIKKGLSRDFQSVAAFSDQKLVFTDSLTAIKGEEIDTDILKNIVGLLNSKLFTYYIFSTGSSTGIEREQHHIQERFSFPAVIDAEISHKVDSLIQFKKEIKINDTKKETTYQKGLDEYILELYHLNSLERDLLDYALKVSIPTYSNPEIILDPPSKKNLLDYANVFVKHFNTVFHGPNEYFAVEIHKTPQFILMVFKIVPNKIKKQIQFIVENNLQNFMNMLGDLSFERRHSLYIQRDLKGFRETSFYIIKPNEFQNWHRAVARMDLIEFMEDLTDFDDRRD